MRERHRTRAGAACAVLLAVATSCSVADNLSSTELLDELDRIVRIEGGPAERRIRYERRAVVSTWYVRAALLQPIAPALGLLFGAASEQELENGAAHVRELLRELPDEIDGDLLTAAHAVLRLGWIAELESNAQSRVVGIDGLATIGAELELPLFRDFTRLGSSPDPDAITKARTAFAAARPDLRPAGGAAPEVLRDYREALAGLVAGPLADGGQRLVLLEELAAAYANEPDDALRDATAAALRTAMLHVTEGLLLRIVQGRAPELVDLRLCAMEQIRRLGGPPAVALLLAAMAASPNELARGTSFYDPDEYVQLRLIHYCGQLRGGQATTSVALPGRRDDVVLAPADFLATTILNEQTYYSKLRTPALVALTWSLERPSLDPDPAWVRAWRDRRP